MTWTMIKGGWYSYIPYTSEAAKAAEIIKSYAVCTCGATKAAEPWPPTGHSDWCSVNDEQPPETEEIPF